MTIDVGVLVGIAGVMIAIFGYVLNRDRDKKSDATSTAEVKVTLTHISSDIRDVKSDVRYFKDQLNSVNKDIVRLDEGLKTVRESTELAHERINNIKEKVGNHNEN